MSNTENNEKPKLTRWSKGCVKPVRIGAYMQKAGSRFGYSYWDGERWSIWELTPEIAYLRREFKAGDQYQNDTWRGLATPPEPPQVKPLVKTRDDLAKDLIALAEIMLDRSTDLKYYGGFDTSITKHASQMFGAAKLVQHWAKGIEATTPRSAP